jgi:N-methylhydantoinase A/oxoprolinase/acetone carboxylase beta subunit
MEKAVRVISLERGFDPRDFALFSFGGAGGLHAADMAVHLRMGGVIVSARAGVLSALGLLLADAVKDYSLAVLKTTDAVRLEDLEKSYRRLELRGARDLAQEGFPPRRIVLERSVDVRCLGQSYEITIPYPRGGRGLEEAFHAEHERLYSYRHPDAPVEIVALRLKARGLGEKIGLKSGTGPVTAGSPAGALRKTQDLFYGGKKYAAGVYDRDALAPGARLKGPALVVDSGSTTLLPPGFGLRIDPFLNLVISRSKGGRA